MAKLVVYGSLVVALFFPWGSGLPVPLNLASLLVKLTVLVLAVTWWPPRMRGTGSTRRSAITEDSWGLAGALLLALYGY